MSTIEFDRAEWQGQEVAEEWGKVFHAGDARDFIDLIIRPSIGDEYVGDYDLDAIFAVVAEWNPRTGRFEQVVTPDEFWGAVEANLL